MGVDAPWIQKYPAAHGPAGIASPPTQKDPPTQGSGLAVPAGQASPAVHGPYVSPGAGLRLREPSKQKNPSSHSPVGDTSPEASQYLPPGHLAHPTLKFPCAVRLL